MVISQLYHELSTNPKYGLTDALIYNDSVYTRTNGDRINDCYSLWFKEDISKQVRQDFPYFSMKDVGREINEIISRLAEHPLSTADCSGLHKLYHEHAYFKQGWWHWRKARFVYPSEKTIKLIQPIESLDISPGEMEQIAFWPDYRAEETMRTWFPGDDDSENVQTILQFLGYCLMEHRDFEKMLVFYGLHGVGKSACLKMIQYFLGHSTVLETQFTNLDDKRFQIAEFVGRTLVCDPDVTTDGKNFSATILKKLVSYDTVSIEKKNVQKQETPNLTCKFLACTNHLMQFKDPEPMLKRILPIKFSNNFRDSEEVKRTSDMSNMFKSVKFRSSLGLAALKAGSALINNGKFSQSVSSIKLSNHWLATADPLAYFLQRMTSHGGSTSIRKVQKAFHEFCESEGIQYHKGICSAANLNKKSKLIFNTYAPIVIRSNGSHTCLLTLR